jgi:hypothetical protein
MAMAEKLILTTSAGAPISANQNALTAGLRTRRASTILQDECGNLFRSPSRSCILV